MFRVGLTGGIGSGKTAVSDRFAELGVSIVDSDVIARELVQPGSAALEKIAKHFGETLLRADGSLDRPQLRRKIFDSPQDRHWLETLLHPLIIAQTEYLLAAASGVYALLSSPLLLEADQRRLVNRLLVVDIPEELQIERSCRRDNLDPDSVRKIIATQASRTTRRAAADDLIDNSGSLKETHAQVDDLHQKYLQMAVNAR